MHKPLRIIKDDARVRLTQQVNLTSAVRAALLTLPEEFSETQLFERIAGISYSGDPRMILPAENRGKVGNIVRKQNPQFKELYYRLVVGLPGVHWPEHSSVIQQDVSASARSAHLRKLPSNLLMGVKNSYSRRSSLDPELQADESAFWVHLAGDEHLAEVLVDGKFPLSILATRGLMVLVFRDEQDCAVSCGCSIVKRTRKCRIREKHKI
jgi:translocator assembly and maintenance protein 41